MQKQYTEKFKSRMVDRMTGPRRMSANALSQEVGVAQGTLSRWLREAGSLRGVTDHNDDSEPTKRPEDWSPHEKLSAVIEAASIADANLGVWLRRKGLKEPHLRQWREALEERAATVFSPAREPKSGAGDRRRVKELERELKRKDKALAETAALLVLQGKMQALWAEEDDATRQTNDEPSSTASRRRRKRERG